jgi:hypothetical protein
VELDDEEELLELEEDKELDDEEELLVLEELTTVVEP